MNSERINFYIQFNLSALKNYKMGKERKKKSQTLSKTKKIKCEKKQSSTELKTFKENKINRHFSPIRKHDNSMDDEDSPQIPLQINIEASQLDKLEHTVQVVHNMLVKNKINKRNAFDAPLIDLEKLVQLVDFTNIDDNPWKAISSAFESNTKIFSFRVEEAHSLTYRILNNMSRNQSRIDRKAASPPKQSKQQSYNNLEYEILDEIDLQRVDGSNLHIQKKQVKINQEDLGYTNGFNPKLERTKRKFCQTGSKGLLLNNIEIDSNFELCLNEKGKFNLRYHGSAPLNLHFQQVHEPLLITQKIENIRRKTDQYKVPIADRNSFEDVWNRIRSGDWDDLKMEVKIEPENMEEVYQYDNMRKVEDVVKIDKKMTDKKVKEKGSIGEIRTTKKEEMKRERNSSDGIEFSQEYIDRSDVFITDQNLERCENQAKTQIQDQNLLPIRLYQNFKRALISNSFVQQPIQSLQNIPQSIREQNSDQEDISSSQIDIKQQQISIRNTKDKMKNLLRQKTDFFNLYRSLEMKQNGISPNLCFLALLHLANQNNLHLQQDNEWNFIIE